MFSWGMQSREWPGSSHKPTQPHSQALLLITVLISRAGCLLSPLQKASGREIHHPVAQWVLMLPALPPALTPWGVTRVWSMTEIVAKTAAFPPKNGELGNPQCSVVPWKQKYWKQIKRKQLHAKKKMYSLLIIKMVITCVRENSQH